MPTSATMREIRRATRHHGVTTGDALDLSLRQTSRCVDDGTLLRLHRNVFADPTQPRTPLRDLAAAVAAGGSIASAWARSSACLWEMWDPHPALPEIVVPYGRLRVIEGVTVHRSRALDPSMITVRNHIRTTKPLITVLDLGVVVSAVDVGDAIIRGLQLKYFSINDVRNAIDLHSRPGRNGISTARRAAELVMIGDRPAESVLEFRFHIGPAQHGLPPYAYQHKVRVGRQNYRIDFAYPDVMLAIEVDGHEFHGPEQEEYDELREADLVLAGWTVMRFGWRRVTTDPASVAAAILMKLGQLGYRAG